MDTLEELFEGTLRHVFYAERQIAKLLPKMTKKTASEKLAEAFRAHLEQTQRQIERLEKVFEVIDAPTKARKSDAVQGAINETEGSMKKAKSHTVRDAALLAAAQALDHYKISQYQTLSGWAQKLGHPEAAQLLDEILHEDKDMDERLSELAISEVRVVSEVESRDELDVSDVSKKASAPRRKRMKGNAAQVPSDNDD